MRRPSSVLGRSRYCLLAAVSLTWAAACSDDDGDPQDARTTTTATSVTSAGADTAPATDAAPITTGPATTSVTSPTTEAGEVTTTTVATSPAPTTEPPPSPPVALGDPDVTFTHLGPERAGLLELEASPDGRLYQVFQSGIVEITDPDGGSPTPALDLTDVTAADGERGLLGLALDPAGERAYVNYTDATGGGETVIAEYEVADDGTFIAETARTVLTIDQPYGNHNGGDLAFGPDGHLYIATGDGGSGGDPDRVALNLSSLLGKILRIDPARTGDDGDPDIVPPDNPFVDHDDARGEIWSYGLRNPWRFTFDEPSGDLWIADVGQSGFEEINVARATDAGLDAGRGANFGWSAYEGHVEFNDDQLHLAAGHHAPVHVYENTGARCSVSGAGTYHGDRVPGLAGGFVFGDFCSGEIWAIPLDGSERIVELGAVPSPAAVREVHGEIYVTSLASGLYRIDPA